MSDTTPLGPAGISNVWSVLGSDYLEVNWLFGVQGPNPAGEVDLQLRFDSGVTIGSRFLDGDPVEFYRQGVEERSSLQNELVYRTLTNNRAVTVHLPPVWVSRVELPHAAAYVVVNGVEHPISAYSDHTPPEA